MSIYKKFAIKFATYIALAWFVCQPLTEVFRYKPYFEMPEEEYEITHKELNAFLTVWGNMMQSSFREKFTSSSLKAEGKHPKCLQTWLEIQHWNIDRFFYDEQRIKDLVEYVDVKHQLSDNAKISRSSHINLNDMNQALEKRLDANLYSDEELDLIETNLYQITEVLSGKAILRD